MEPSDIDLVSVDLSILEDGVDGIEARLRYLETREREMTGDSRTDGQAMAELFRRTDQLAEKLAHLAVSHSDLKRRVTRRWWRNIFARAK